MLNTNNIVSDVILKNSYNYFNYYKIKYYKSSSNDSEVFSCSSSSL